ncbi:MAG: DUF5333 domain-containing protein [Neomegalonema sp.]|nr:DUF5333 domain-containing protein [Neomegalonema sp.]
MLVRLIVVALVASVLASCAQPHRGARNPYLDEHGAPSSLTAIEKRYVFELVYAFMIADNCPTYDVDTRMGRLHAAKMLTASGRFKDIPDDVMHAFGKSREFRRMLRARFERSGAVGEAQYGGLSKSDLACFLGSYEKSNNTRIGRLLRYS